jgi:hypothetical protein
MVPGDGLSKTQRGRVEREARSLGVFSGNSRSLSGEAGRNQVKYHFFSSMVINTSLRRVFVAPGKPREKKPEKIV